MQRIHFLGKAWDDTMTDALKCLKTMRPSIGRSVALCTYMIPDVSNNVRTRRIHKFTQVTVGFIWPSVTVTSRRGCERESANS